MAENVKEANKPGDEFSVRQKSLFEQNHLSNLQTFPNLTGQVVLWRAQGKRLQF